MNISDLKAAADLACLRLRDEEIASLGSDMEKALGCLSKMREADVSAFLADRGKRPTANRLRRDERTEDVRPDDLLERAPELEDRFIVIPNVL